MGKCKVDTSPLGIMLRNARRGGYRPTKSIEGEIKPPPDLFAGERVNMTTEPKQREMTAPRCIKCDFCRILKRPEYLNEFKMEITLTCEITGQTLKVTECPAFY